MTCLSFPPGLGTGAGALIAFVSWLEMSGYPEAGARACVASLPGHPSLAKVSARQFAHPSPCRQGVGMCRLVPEPRNAASLQPLLSSMCWASLYMQAYMRTYMHTCLCIYAYILTYKKTT